MMQKSLSFPEFLKFISSIKRGTLWISLILAFSFCAITVFAVRDTRKDDPADVAAAEIPTTASITATAPGAVNSMQALVPDSAELLILTSNGFVPDHLTRPVGKFLLIVEDRSGLDQATLQLKSKAGASLSSTLSAIQKAEVQDVFDLQPGTYFFTEANHPELTCEITITP